MAKKHKERNPPDFKSPPLVELEQDCCNNAVIRIRGVERYNLSRADQEDLTGNDVRVMEIMATALCSAIANGEISE